MNKEIVSLVDVTKEYPLSLFKKKKGVDSLNFTATTGQVIGILGANGSGKSTTFKLLLGFLRPTRGQVFLFGEPNSTRARQRIGYLPEVPRFPVHLTAIQALRYYGRLMGLSGSALEKRGEALLDLVGLAANAHEKISGFSKGMGQRLAIAQSLLNTPELLIFDEPMSGLDPIGRIEVRELINQVHRELPHATILMSTHILSDAENLCTHAALLKKGKLETFGEISTILRSNETAFSVTIRGVREDQKQKWESEWGATVSPMGLILKVNDPQSLERCLHEANAFGHEVIDISSNKADLEKALFVSNPQAAEAK